MAEQQLDKMEVSPILLTGASGYVGGRLVRVLQEGGYPVRCMTRRPEYLAPRLPDGLEVVQGDVLDADSLTEALEGIKTAYYLIHSMGGKDSFEEQDRKAASNFAQAAREAGVRRIIYLGGLGDPEKDLSPHLRSRQEVGKILRESGVQVIEFRASIVLGSGSLSYEMIRALVERLPVMITPRWVNELAQPIAIEDLLSYLSAALTKKIEGSQVYEIGGPDQVSYEDLMKVYARQRKLHRLMVPVPFLTPRLSSLWLTIVTPLYAGVGRELINSIRNPTVVQDDQALRDFSVQPRGVPEAIARALSNEDQAIAETRWSDALANGTGNASWSGFRFGNRLIDSRIIQVPATAEEAFTPIRKIGGASGWYYGEWLWAVRGWLDLLFGGVGMRRGRRDPDHLRTGDVLDCWRVEQIEPNRLLRLAAEMKLPGRAWLEFELDPEGCTSSAARRMNPQKVPDEEALQLASSRIGDSTSSAISKEKEETPEHQADVSARQQDMSDDAKQASNVDDEYQPQEDREELLVSPVKRKSGEPCTLIRQTAIFDPVGLGGLLYWYSVYPFHQFVFAGMLQGIAERALTPERRKLAVWQKWAGLAFFLLITFGAAALGSMVTLPKIEGWYQSLAKPTWTPPSELFGPVWTVLYILMACSAWIVWKKFGWRRAFPSLTCYGIQLTLNALWSLIFFGWQNPGLALFEILCLWLAILITAFLFWKRSAAAGALLMPYLAWVTFAAALNFEIWRINS
ncbi:Hypothetical protein PBC10988_22980 [Planctomycetales bacterium 10988]|nr:Hypothetical protein PBC10988_22980 [Planctomycetales bacterium 10988]